MRLTTEEWTALRVMVKHALRHHRPVDGPLVPGLARKLASLRDRLDNPDQTITIVVEGPTDDLDWEKNVGRRLRAARQAAGYERQLDLASNLRMAQSMLSALENGLRVPNTRNLRKLAVALGTTTDYLLGLDGDY